MPKRTRSIKLSIGELKIMGILWKRGHLTLSEAYEHQSGNLGYTTIQTMLNRLVIKGVASRSKTSPMKYRALVSPHDAGATLLQLLIDTVGGGSILPLINQLTSYVTLTSEEARTLKQAIDQATKRSLKRPALRKGRSS